MIRRHLPILSIGIAAATLANGSLTRTFIGAFFLTLAIRLPETRKTQR